MDSSPVFVDGSGRRRLALRWSGIAVAGALAAFLVVVGIALITQVDVPRADLPRETVTHAPRKTPPHRRHRHASTPPHHRTRP